MCCVCGVITSGISSAVLSKRGCIGEWCDSLNPWVYMLYLEGTLGSSQDYSISTTLLYETETFLRS
jgi:hypothetical protein